MLNWSDIDTVLLDMDGTLLDLYFDNYFWLQHLPKRYAQIHQIELEESHQTLESKSAALKGSLNWYCVDHWSEDLDIDIESLKNEISHLIRYRPWATEFLRFLKNLNKKILLVTNAHPKSLNLKASAVKLDQHIETMVSSHSLALAKENQGFWPKLAEQHNLNLTRSLFIDDSLPVLNCAKKEGVGFTLQILQPDTELAPKPNTTFPGIINFDELMV